jgi:hypothetical protein
MTRPTPPRRRQGEISIDHNMLWDVIAVLQSTVDYLERVPLTYPYIDGEQMVDRQMTHADAVRQLHLVADLLSFQLWEEATE